VHVTLLRGIGHKFNMADSPFRKGCDVVTLLFLRVNFMFVSKKYGKKII